MTRVCNDGFVPDRTTQIGLANTKWEKKYLTGQACQFKLWLKIPQLHHWLIERQGAVLNKKLTDYSLKNTTAKKV